MVALERAPSVELGFELFAIGNLTPIPRTASVEQQARPDATSHGQRRPDLTNTSHNKHDTLRG